MTRVEENGKMIESLAERECDIERTNDGVMAFQHISRSLAVIADESRK